MPENGILLSGTRVIYYLKRPTHENACIRPNFLSYQQVGVISLSMQQVFLIFDLLRSCLEFPRKDLPLISFAKKSGKKLVDKTLLEEAHEA